MRKIILAIATTAILSGCSTDVVPLSQAINAPSERVFKYQDTAKTNALITVVRDSGFGGSGCLTTVFINGERAARLDPKEKVTFHINSGEWVIGAAYEGKALCSSGKERQERDFNISPGEEKVLRVYTDSNGNVDIKPTTIR
ncbi:membrane lipoprotein lipid attachment site-containing protein [Serratia marcescens]|uniref:membrane lipoprotein lipid attachment site-containing protein n=1 Tax=Serratia marcescens TaxID=615 RepID=UPI0037D6D08E